MLRITALLFAIIITCATAFGQAAKGVDKQTERARDTGTRSAGTNGSKTDVGTGRGIDFGSGRTPAVTMLPNPYRMTARRDVLLKAIQDLMRDRKLVVDETA